MRGTLAPKTQPVQVNVPSAGRVIGSLVQLWQKVKKGQVLFTLDALSRDPQDAALQLSIQRNAATQSRQDIAAAQVELADKQRVLQSTRTIFALGGVPKADLDVAVAAVHTAEAALRRAKAQLASAQAQLALLNRSRSVTVVSPIDGQITQLADLHGEQVLAAGQTALGILPAGVPLVFRGQAAERDRPKLRPGARVQVAWSGYPRQKYGVTEGVLGGIAPTSEVGKDGQLTYQVEVRLPQHRRELFLSGRPLVPGMMGEAHVLSGDRTVLRLLWDWIRGVDPWT